MVNLGDLLNNIGIDDLLGLFKFLDLFGGVPSRSDSDTIAVL